MNTPYRALFAMPGTRGLLLAGLLARIPLPMTGIGIITLLVQLRGSYALAGAVSATFVLAYALLSPQVSRQVDRSGQRRILPIATGISVFGILLLLSGASWQAPDWTLFAGALLAGCMPSMSAMVRARWTALYRGQPRLQTAYALETVLDEVTFIAGPPLSVGLSVMVWPQAGPLVASLLLILGTIALLAQHGSEPAIAGPDADATGATPLLRLANLRLLILLMTAMGIIVGSVDIGSVAFAEQAGQPAAASLVLSAYAMGSCAAGLLFGALKLQAPLHRLLLLGSMATAAATLPLLMASSIMALATVVLVAGLFFSPTMIVAMSLVERLVPERQLTEAMTWLLAGLNVGVALGAAASGQVVDNHGTEAGFSLALVGGAMLLSVALWAHHRLQDSEVRR